MSLDRLKALEEKLVSLENENMFLLDSVNAGIWSWSMKEDILTWNDRMFELFDRNQNAFTGKVSFFFESVHPCDRSRVGEEVMKSKLEGSPFQTKYRIIISSNKERVIVAFGLTSGNIMRGICLPYPEEPGYGV